MENGGLVVALGLVEWLEPFRQAELRAVVVMVVGWHLNESL